jgi:3-hydroxybutyryl-CoA dehydrogenase
VSESVWEDQRMSVSLLGVVGAGFMGSGIAESAAAAGKQVVLYEPQQEPLVRSRERLATSVAKAVERGKLSGEEAAALTGRVSYTTELDELRGVDAVIEAAVENPAIKGELFERLDAALPDAVFLASNTSSIPIGELAARTQRPQRVLGLHFFSPVPVMKLVEVVVALDTSEQTVAAAEQFAQEIGKQSIRAGDRSGFIVNMLLVPYLMAAVRMYETGLASREDIDTGMKLGCGHPMGPLELSDFIGLEVLQAVCESRHDELNAPEYAPPPLLRRMVAAGHHGRKTGRGFYDYAPASAAERSPA